MEPLESLKKLGLASTFQKILKNKSVDDIILIGSFVKGKIKFKDIDICVVMNSKDEETIRGLYTDCKKKNVDIHITKTKYSDLLEDASLWTTILHEGFSVKKKKKISALFNFAPYLIFNYSLKNLSATNKQTFAHALYGTGGRESILKKNKGIKLGAGFIAVPIDNSEEMRSFFERWDVLYEARRVWL